MYLWREENPSETPIPSHTRVSLPLRRHSEWMRCSAGSAASYAMLQSKPRGSEIPCQRSGNNPLAALLANSSGEWFGHSLGVLSYLADKAVAVCFVGRTCLRNLCPLSHREPALLRRRIWFRIDPHWLSRLPGCPGWNGACRQRLQGGA